MFSGIAACPLMASLLRRYIGVSVSRRAQFMVALLVFIAGRIAVVIVLHRPFLPLGLVSIVIGLVLAAWVSSAELTG
jgi:hypothetical protein